ncbi:MAG TPA: PrsW family intramembrane metalloprotease [Casimicrobiaceae bacterium]|nr:PrsW family intramembrane metalloprotease [Casimicrobiaceae bacterium]
MTFTLLIAIAVPAAFLYALHWLDLYGSDRPRVVLACVAWGLVAFVLSFAVNRFCIDILGWPRVYVSTRSAPFVEELFKSGMLVYLVRRGRYSYFVDGAIYGFASGIGFAIIENLRYVQLFPDNPLSLVVVRDFSSALAHGTATAMTGIALGRFALSTRTHSRLAPLLLGLSGAMAMHYLWNNFANFTPLSVATTEWVLVGVGLLGVALVAATILFGLRNERRRLHDTLGMKLRVSDEESNVIQHMGDLDRLLQPIDQSFGRGKRRQVASLLHVEAQLGLKQDAHERTVDPALRLQLEQEIAELEKVLDAARRAVGVYVMLYVRSIFPVTRWSLWARIAQGIADRRESLLHVWRLAGQRSGTRDTGANVFEGLRAVLDTRAVARSLHPSHLEGLPAPMRHCLQWCVQTTRITVERAVAELGHEEKVAHELLSELTARGFVHRASAGGEIVFEVMHHVSSGAVHLWHRAKSTPANQRSRP